MPRSKTPSSKSARSLKAIQGLPWLSSPPLLPGEDAGEYDRLHADISTAIKPSNIIEQIWVHDLVYLTWEINRWRRLKAKLVATAYKEGLEQLLQNRFGWKEAETLAKGWAIGDQNAVDRVNEFLAASNLTMEAVVAQTYVLRILIPERFEQMLIACEARRNATLREIERHRFELAAAARRALEQIDVAETAHGKPIAAAT